MKHRQGYVSNSSSSSYMIGIGKVVDREKLESFIQSEGISFNDNFNVFKVSDIDPYYITHVNNRYSVESFI